MPVYTRHYKQPIEVVLGDRYSGEVTSADNDIADETDFNTNHRIDLGAVCEHVIIFAETPDETADIVFMTTGETEQGVTWENIKTILEDAASGKDKRRKLKASDSIAVYNLSFQKVRYLYFLKRNAGTVKIYVDANEIVTQKN
jgi:hypothetical protein